MERARYPYQNNSFFLVFGRVPLFYYFLHMIFIDLLAIIGILLFGGNCTHMILTGEGFMSAQLATYGYPLYVVYLVWIGVVIALYPFSKWYMEYKAKN